MQSMRHRCTSSGVRGGLEFGDEVRLDVFELAQVEGVDVRLSGAAHGVMELAARLILLGTICSLHSVGVNIGRHGKRRNGIARCHHPGLGESRAITPLGVMTHHWLGGYLAHVQTVEIKRYETGKQRYDVPLRPSRVGRVGVVGAPVAKAAVVSRRNTRPLTSRQSRGRHRRRHTRPPAADLAARTRDNNGDERASCEQEKRVGRARRGRPRVGHAIRARPGRSAPDGRRARCPWPGGTAGGSAGEPCGLYAGESPPRPGGPAGAAKQRRECPNWCRSAMAGCWCRRSRSIAARR